MAKIKIVGAGPAGLSAAINLAKAGYEVEVFEKNPEVGIRFHNDLQGLENWSGNKDALKKLKKMNININFDHHPFKNLNISNGDKVWDFNFKKPAFYLVNRGKIPGSLDCGLKEQALDAGADIHFNHTISEKNANIVATGPDATQKFAAAQGIVFKTDLKDMAMGLVNHETSVKGYSYLLVTDGQATLATVLFDGFDDLNHCFKKTQKVFSTLVPLDIKDPQKMGGIGSFSLKKPCRINGQLYAGEATGLQDLLWGFGIKFAMESGFLAARSIIEHEDYEKAFHIHFHEKLKASAVNRFLWEKLGTNNFSFIMNQIHNSRDPLKRLNWMHEFNIFHKMLYPFAIRYIRKRYGNLML